MSNNFEAFDKNGKALSISDVMKMLPMLTPLKEVTRVEVIDENGRSYVNRHPTNQTKISLQDGCRTLKVFISDEQ